MWFGRFSWLLQGVQLGAILEVELPLNEIVIDFYDKLKSYSKGYASFDYQVYDYFEGDLVKLNILVNSDFLSLVFVS